MGLRSKNVLALLDDKTCNYQDKVSLGTKDQFGWREFTYRGIGQLSRRIARYFIRSRIKNKR